MDEEVNAKKEQTAALETLLKDLNNELAEKQGAQESLTAQHMQTTQELARHRLDLQAAQATGRAQDDLEAKNAALREKLAAMQSEMTAQREELFATQRDLDQAMYRIQSKEVLDQVCTSAVWYPQWRISLEVVGFYARTERFQGLVPLLPHLCPVSVPRGGGGGVGYIRKAREKGYFGHLGLHAVLMICLRFSSFLDSACVACCLFLSTGSYRIQINATCCCFP